MKVPLPNRVRIVSTKPKNIEFTVFFGSYIVVSGTKMELKRIRKCFEAYLRSRPAPLGTGASMCLKWSRSSHVPAVLLSPEGKVPVQSAGMHESA